MTSSSRWPEDLPRIIIFHDFGLDEVVNQLVKDDLLFTLWYWQRQVHEGIVSRGRLVQVEISTGFTQICIRSYLVACKTFHPVSILSLEQVYDQTVVPLLVNLPFFLGGNRRRQGFESGFSFWGHLNRRRFRANSIKVFMQAVQKETEEFL